MKTLAAGWAIISMALAGVYLASVRRDGFTWSVHRPHTIIGYAVGNANEHGRHLGCLCHHMPRNCQPFAFPGSSVQWNSLTDMTDARLLAHHLQWAATSPGARNQAFNVVNGDVFRWSWMWERIAQCFGLQAAPLKGEGTPLEQQLADAAPLWADIVRKYKLVEPNLNVLASAWHTDADLGRPIEVVTDVSKSRKLGFLEYQETSDSLFDLFTRSREDRLIP